MKAPMVGDRVQTTAAAAMGKKLAIQRYKANAKVKRLSGYILTSEGSGRGRKWRVHWDDVKIGESVHCSKVLENAGSVEEIEDDVVMAEHESDEKLPACRRAGGGGTRYGKRRGAIINQPVSCQRHQMDHSR